MANPTGLTDLPETEYVEIYNLSNTAISLAGWSFIYGEQVTALPNTILPVGSYTVLYRAGRDIFVENTGIALPIATFPSSLVNTGRLLQLKNSKGIVIDSVTYATAKAAQSYERDATGNWYLSTDTRGGTPGKVNSPKDDPEQPPVIPAPDNSQPGDVLINEIMANPVGLTAFPETEYVEIFNASDTIISLTGWSFIYDGHATALPDTLLPIGSYAVLYRAGRDIFLENKGIALPIATFPASLANTGKTLELKNSQGLLIDSVTYSAAKAACSYERDTTGNWYFSTDTRGGTPGAINSPKDNSENPNNTEKPGDIPEEDLLVNSNEFIFNELLPEPFAGGSEYIELYNRSGSQLYLAGLSIAVRRTDGTLSTRYSLSSITEPVPPEGYAVLTSNREGVLNFYATPSPEVIYELKLPTLNNTGSTLVLVQTKDGNIIDEITYSSKWHDIAIKNTKGVALERIDPEADTQSSTNWKSATSEVGYGTPGYDNSQHGVTGTESSVSLAAPEYIPGPDEYRIAYQTDKAGYRCHIEVLTPEGKKMAEIANNQLIGFEGEIRWDGSGLGGSRLRPGIYVFYAELYHPEGQKKTYKKVFLVKP
jgi:hypothetical protein